LSVDFKLGKQEVNGTLILPPLVFPASSLTSNLGCLHSVHKSAADATLTRTCLDLEDGSATLRLVV